MESVLSVKLGRQPKRIISVGANYGGIIMDNKLKQFQIMNKKSLTNVTGGGVGELFGHAVYFMGRGLRENGKALNKALTKH